jgi:diketogulonate reductase-like aldo/keto reductase
MELKSLGNTNLRIPEIGLGTWKYQGGVEPLRQGIELGASLIDTAEVYGTEDVVGEAVAGIRDKVFIATKVSGDHLHYDDVLRAVETSLRQLRMDYIDLYQIHWPNERIPIKETMHAMETLVDAGRIKSIGVSNFSARELREAQRAMSKCPIVSNQVLYNLNRRDIEQELLSSCQEHHITVIAYTPLDDGRLAAVSRTRQSRRMQGS